MFTNQIRCSHGDRLGQKLKCFQPGVKGTTRKSIFQAANDFVRSCLSNYITRVHKSVVEKAGPRYCTCNWAISGDGQ